MRKRIADNITQRQEYELIKGTRIGKITAIDDNGTIIVDYHGNPAGHAVKAQMTSSARKIIKQHNAVNKKVLLAFENDNPEQPVIIDTIYSLLDDMTENPVEPKEDEIKTAIIDGQRIVFDADEEVVLRCGDASITMTKDGKVLIRGAYVSSNSSGVNRVKGGSVSIN